METPIMELMYYALFLFLALTANVSLIKSLFSLFFFGSPARKDRTANCLTHAEGNAVTVLRVVPLGHDLAQTQGAAGAAFQTA